MLEDFNERSLPGNIHKGGGNITGHPGISPLEKV